MTTGSTGRFLLRIAALFLLVLGGIALTGAVTAKQSAAVGHGITERRYDPLIRRATRRHLPPDVDWQFFKALVRQESNFDPRARSRVGAIGLCQVMPGTAGDFGVSASALDDPAINIDTAARFLDYLWGQWRDVRAGPPHYTRSRFVLASYNCGLARTRRAYEAAGHRQEWAHLKPHLPSETQQYVERVVDFYYPLYLAGGNAQVVRFRSHMIGRRLSLATQ